MSAKTYYLEKADVYYKILPNAMIEAQEKIKGKPIIRATRPGFRLSFLYIEKNKESS